MTRGRATKFGAFVRRERESRKIGLREMAKKIGVSPTYLSKVERDEFPPPAESKIAAIAQVLDLDVDELLALAGKVASDLTNIITKHPREFALILRGTAVLPSEERSKAIDKLVETMKARVIPPYVEE